MQKLYFAFFGGNTLRTRIKYCGITRLEDAQAAISVGADALGFVFYPPSPRAITAKNAATIIEQLPPLITLVGLFVNASQDEILAAVAASGINCIQLHGNEDEAFCKAIEQATNLPVIKAIRVRNNEFIPAHPDQYASVSAILLDAFSPSAYGGTGESFNWESIPLLNKPMILAGGLTPDNVVMAIETAKPFAVDVSGGIETDKKGIKDAKKMQQFYTNSLTAVTGNP